MFQLYNLLDTALTIYSFALIIYIFMSWFPGARESAFGEFLGKISEPYLEVFRRFIPPLGMIDLSPIVAIITLSFARMGLGTLFSMLLS
ncbi:YggT family protein [Virgibacillus natechei]|uniref:YggT family protein n=1 Tax=Virgibacillus natechei TaxID=1216297 RepID=UPI001AE29592|nr:YggT family protein [Virgibacillus natechei]UZD14544.1 YggT family protein [Virgibacillus natechei]